MIGELIMAKKTTIGGQALIEGILMRGPKKVSTVVRKSDGEMIVKTEPNPSADRVIVSKIPVIRGIVGFLDSMKAGFGALMYSASFFDDEPNEKPGWLEKKIGAKNLDRIFTALSVVFGIAIPVFLFFFLPTFIVSFFKDISFVGRNLLEGGVRIAIFLAFIILTSFQKDIQRTYMYHGAEHKSIHCYEAGMELTVENVSKNSRFHPRCGTSFLFVVMIISILLFSWIRFTNVYARIGMRILLIPLVVGVSYEVNRLVGRYDNILTKILRMPGLWLQRCTTREPDESMMEVAITALNEVIPEKQNEDVW